MGIEVGTPPGLCICHEAGNTKLCFSKKIIGALDKSQESQCKETFIEPLSNSYENQLTKFKEMGRISSVCLKKDVSDYDYYNCVSEEAKKLKGIK